MTLLFKFIPLIGLSVAFSLSEIGFFAIQKQLESTTRSGWLANERVAIALPFGLLMLFTASFFGIFLTANRLPYTPLTDVVIGLVAMTAATLAAYGVHGWVNRHSI